MRAEKQFLLDEIEEKIDNFNSFLITRYDKLGANLANDLRVKMAESGGDFEVVRKRLFVKVAEKRGLEIGESFLHGHLGLAFTGLDAIETLKVLIKFCKANPDNMEVVGGYFDGTIYEKEQVQKLANLPGKDQMRAQFLGLLEAPAAQTLSVMEALLCSVPHCLQNKADQQEA